MHKILCLIASVWSFGFLAACSIPTYTAGEVPYVPTPMNVVDRMLALAEIKPGDVVYDLGSGDGRIIIEAAKRYGVRGVGIEIDPDLVAKARNNAFRENVEELVEFRAQDALTVNVSEATVVTLYMLPEFNAKLRPTFDNELRPGARVVSHDFEIGGWTPIRTEKIKGDLLHDHTIYLFRVNAGSR
jgi:SAM-dependent methyltransferase